MRAESVGFEETSRDVVCDVAEAAEVLESSVDRLGRSVAGAGAVEKREDVGSPLLQGPAEFAELDQAAPTYTLNCEEPRAAQDLLCSGRTSLLRTEKPG